MQIEAIGLIELTSVARGVVVTDAMVKQAEVRVLQSHPICPGKYMVLVAGPVGEVRSAMAVGVHYAGPTMVDKLLIDNLHPQVIPAIANTRSIDKLGSIGIIETYGVASTILAADKACKAAEIELIEIRLATGLGGKAYVTFTGEQHMVEAAMQAGVAALDNAMLFRKELIEAPHEDTQRVVQ